MNDAVKNLQSEAVLLANSVHFDAELPGLQGQTPVHADHVLPMTPALPLVAILKAPIVCECSCETQSCGAMRVVL